VDSSSFSGTDILCFERPGPKSYQHPKTTMAISRLRQLPTGLPLIISNWHPGQITTASARRTQPPRPYGKPYYRKQYRNAFFNINVCWKFHIGLCNFIAGKASEAIRPFSMDEHNFKCHSCVCSIRSLLDTVSVGTPPYCQCFRFLSWGLMLM